MQRSTITSMSMVAVAGIAALLLAGCSSSPSNEPSGTQPDSATASDENAADLSGASGEALLSYGDVTYSAQLEFCSLSGTEDALFDGMAYDDAGEEVGYLTGDFGGLSDVPHGEARIDFGATDNFQSMDEFIAMGTVMGDIVITDFSETSLIVVGGMWDQGGTQLPTATLKITC